MLERFRKFLQTSGGRIAGIALTVLAVIAGAYSVKSNLGGDEASRLSKNRVFVCAETGKPFDYELTVNSKIPAPSPHSGKDTGHPGEPCFWTKDGKTKEEATWVLLNTYAKKPEPTFCPDCGRVVRPLNPAPLPGGTPPPTQEEMKKRRSIE